MPDAKRPRVGHQQGEDQEGVPEEEPARMPGATEEHAEGENPDVSEAQASKGLRIPETPSA